MPTPSIRTVLSLFAFAGVAFAVVGLLIRVTLRDTVAWVDVVYYGSPLPVIASVFAASGLIWLAARRPMLGIAGLLVATTVLGWWTQDAFGRTECSARNDDTKVMFWNIARGSAGWDGVVEEVRRSEADIVGLTEATEQSWRFDWVSRLPGYQFTSLGRGIAILTRGEVLSSQYYQFTPGSHCMELELQLDGRRLRLILVDLAASLRLRRRYVIDKVIEIAERPASAPTVVMGDFNTPTDSVWLAPLRARYDNALEVAGSGLRVTWPRYVPLLAIDHIWIERGVEVRCARTRFTRSSDHAQVHATLAPW